MRIPGKRRVIRLLRSRWRTKARPRALPPREPEPIRKKLDSEGLNVSALKSAILVDRLDQIAPQVFRAGEIRNFSRTELRRQGKLGACHQPMGEVVALRV